jgi:ubiquinone/menaquinone biosynthesis C-methylase UbiE
MNATHPMLPDVSHDERARLGYIVDLKAYLDQSLAPANLARAQAAERELAASGQAPNVQGVRALVEQQVPYQHWMTLVRHAQEMMWDVGIQCVDRQLDALQTRAEAMAGREAVRRVPGFEVPNYISAVDTHLMPGGYHAEASPTDLRQGALFDLIAAVYHRGRNGGQLNDLRGHTVVQHLYERFPDVQPRRLLEMGCTVGHSTGAVASYFPEATLEAVDVGAPVLNYALARARGLGLRNVHFAQENAESTSYPDASFDVVYSCVMLHETSGKALPRIMQECYRLLRPGGVVIHLEVPMRYRELTPAEQLRGEIETFYNNEPFWRGACQADLVGVLEKTGFEYVAEGYQPTVMKAERGARGFQRERGPVYRFWYVASGRRPARP